MKKVCYEASEVVRCRMSWLNRMLFNLNWRNPKSANKPDRAVAMKRILFLPLVMVVASLSATAQGKLYKVGDYYNENGREGVVFEVDESGRHGKIVSLKESVARVKWAAYPKEQKRFLGAVDRRDGRNNQAIVTATLGWQEKFPAFAWCADQGEDWYLPAVDELDRFVKAGVVHTAVNQTLAQLGAKQLAKKGEFRWYWSSTELLVKKKAAQVFCLYVSDGNIQSAEWKYMLCYVRAVAVF